MTEPWFDPIRFGVLYGAIGGSALGVLGGILGAASGYLAPRGRGRSLILGAFTILLVVGLVHLVVGLYAFISGQPYGIWYALVLIGVILSSVMGGLLPVVRKRYAQAEARRVNAAVLRQGYTNC
jgi:hypothetical protein